MSRMPSSQTVACGALLRFSPSSLNLLHISEKWTCIKTEASYTKTQTKSVQNLDTDASQLKPGPRLSGLGQSSVIQHFYPLPGWTCPH